MKKNGIIGKLQDVVQLDIDASFAYEQALKNIDDTTIYQNIDEFRNDHMRHIADLNNLIVEYGGEPIERKKDFKGFLIQGFTSLRSITGTFGALKAMESNEELTNRTYHDALKENDIPPDVRLILEKNYSDEKRHLKYIQDAIKSFEK